MRGRQESVSVAARVDVDLTIGAAVAPKRAGAGASSTLDWHASSYDLLNGLEVRDHSDSISPDAFRKLFSR